MLWILHHALSDLDFTAGSERPGGSEQAIHLPGGATDSDCSAAVLFMNYSFTHDKFFATLRFSVRGWEVLQDADY